MEPPEEAQTEEAREEESEEKAVHIDIDIPDILKKKLEDDCFYINKRKKVRQTCLCVTNYKRAVSLYICRFSIDEAQR